MHMKKKMGKHERLCPDKVYISMMVGAVMKQKNVLVHSCFIQPLAVRMTEVECLINMPGC